MKSPNVYKSQGQLPSGWDCNVIFIANINSLFYGNEFETKILRNEIGSIDTYGGRLVPFLNLLFGKSQNLLVLERTPDPKLLEYFKKDLKLNLPELYILSHDAYDKITNFQQGYECKELKVLRDHPASHLDGYVTDSGLENLAEKIQKSTISTSAGSRKGNNKLLLHEFLNQQNLPVFDTFIAEDNRAVQKHLPLLKKMAYSRAVVKAQIGASGIGMVRMDLNLPREIPKYLFYEGACLVQGWLDEEVPGIERVGSPSIQIFVNHEGIYLWDITEQILSPESVHEGNVSPPPYLIAMDEIWTELFRQAECAGRWLHSLGYRGTGSTDFLIVKRNKKNEVRICEINARVTGATYPSMLAKHFLSHGAWLMRNVRFSPTLNSGRIFDRLKKKNLLFCKSDKKGILPINFNLDRKDLVCKGQFLALADTHDEVVSLMDNFKYENIGDFDRD
ncbi:hypothetical protein IIB34_06015 [PVC group bacterium]|nr:hypothetical protein [PVC group bacterium]